MTTSGIGKPAFGGGAATARGINFQAAVTAICNVHLARGIPLGWLVGIGQDIPVSVAAETNGPGDDIRIKNQKGEIIEAQVKAGLAAGDRLWDSLMALARGISGAEIHYGVLVVSPDSSGTIKNELKTDIRHLGDGRSDALHSLGEMFRDRLVADGLDVPSICARLRIVTVHCETGDDASTKATMAEIAHLVADQTRAQEAWDILSRDAATLIEYRGQRSATSIIQLLRSRSIQLKLADASPAAIISRLSDWAADANETFSVFGIPKPLPIDTGWIPVSIVVRGSEEKTPVGLAEALELYHNWQKRGFGNNPRGSTPETFGRFYKLCVVVAGPGMGKSTLLKKLARLYAHDAFPVLSVKLSLIATRMKETGASFEESLFTHGLDGSGLSRSVIEGAGIGNWIVLCDGLDECGNLQEMIADGLLKLVAGKPRLTVILTTRPVGYYTGLLRNWRHYELLPLDADKPGQHISRLLEAIYPDEATKREEVSRFALDELTKSEATKTVLRSPLLLGLATSLAIQGKAFGESKEQLYERLFDIIDSIPSSREASAKPGRPVLLRFLEILAWDTVEHPASPIVKTLDRCSKALAGELHCGDLEAATVASECSAYWQSVGLLESVSHAGDQTLTFIHKTFGEYAAGRYIAQASASDRAKIVPALFASESADEVLDFAGALGAAEELCAVLLTAMAMGSKRTTNIARCVRLEEPYPVESGTIPPSPRDDLVRAVKRIGPLSNEQLFQMATDRQIRNVVERDVLARVSSDRAFAAEFLKQVSDGTMPAKLLENGLRDLAHLEPDQTVEVVKMLSDKNPELRYAALGILDEAYLNRNEILPWLDKLEADASDDIRQHVLWISNNKFPGV